MKKFRRAAAAVAVDRSDPFQEWALNYGARAFINVPTDFGATLEDIVEDIQRDHFNWPPGSKPGRAEVADSLCALLMAGLVEMA